MVESYFSLRACTRACVFELFCLTGCKSHDKAREYDQPMTLRGRDTEQKQLHDTKKTRPTEMLKIKDVYCFKTLSCCLILLINVKMPTNVGILTFMSRINVTIS